MHLQHHQPWVSVTWIAVHSNNAWWYVTVLLLCTLIFNLDFYNAPRTKSVYCEQFSHTALVSASCLLHLLTTSRGSTEYPAHTKPFRVNPLWDGRALTKSPCKPISQSVCPHHGVMRDYDGKCLFSQSDVGRIPTSEVSPGNIRLLKACEVLSFPFAYRINTVSAPQTHTTEVSSTTRHCSTCAEAGRIQKSWQVRNWLPR